MGHAHGCGVLGALLRNIQGEIRAIGGAAGLHLGRFFFRETRDFLGMSFRRSLGLGLLFGVLFFFKDGATDKSVRFRFGRGFLVFGLDEIGGQRVDLILV